MRLRLILQPAWLRFTVWAAFLAVWWGLFTSLQPGYELESAVLSAIVFGGAVGGYLTVTTQSIHRAALVAVSGLNQLERSEAINAVLRGGEPADRDVRASAARLGRAYLRDKSADQLRCAQIWSWITVGALVAAGVAGAVRVQRRPAVFCGPRRAGRGFAPALGDQRAAHSTQCRATGRSAGLILTLSLLSCR